MPDQVKVRSDAFVVRQIIGNRDRYAGWFGAGTSVEAGVMTAQQICAGIRTQLLKTEGIKETDTRRVKQFETDRLRWNDTSRRYTTCIDAAYPNRASRLVFFRDILRGAQPSFCHFAAALLIEQGYLRRTAFTTNFDHLLEDAFTHLRITECLPIRNDDERGYWEPDRTERHFVVKLHGDIDTQNILNTKRETFAISEIMQTMVVEASRGSGMVVLGTTGNELSIASLFNRLRAQVLGASGSVTDGVLSFGLMWGVYMGEPKPLKPLSSAELGARVARQIKKTDVNPLIVDLIQDAENDLFCFFPVWGAGQFMLDLVQATERRRLIANAGRYLDHEIRLRNVFTSAGLTPTAVTKHLTLLREQQRTLDRRAEMASPESMPIRGAVAGDGVVTVQVIYGDITSRALMGAGEFAHKRRAVVSPEDTCVSAGGGVAYALLKKAGPEVILNELAKFEKIPQCSVAVTSGGMLPVHYILHAATLSIGIDATYSVSEANVRATVQAILDKASALDIEMVWVPLLAAGVASMNPEMSYLAILKGISEWRQGSGASTSRPITITIVVFRPDELSSSTIIKALGALFGQKPAGVGPAAYEAGLPSAS